MKSTPSNHTPASKSPSVAQNQSVSAGPGLQPRPVAGAERMTAMLQQAENSPQVRQLKHYQSMADRGNSSPWSLRADLIQRKAQVVQLAQTHNFNGVYYATEDFTHSREKKTRERPKEVVIYDFGKVNKDNPQPPISFYNTTTNSYDDQQGYHKGHLAGRQFGGTYKNYNIIPMIPGFNVGDWSNTENEIKHELGNKKRVTIKPIYGNNKDRRIPTSFKLDSTSGNSATVPHAVAKRKQMSKQDKNQIVHINNNAENLAHAESVLKKAAKSGWIPMDYQNSPYYKLDVMWLNGAYSGNPRSRSAFQQWQRNVLISYHKSIHSGKIISDAYVNGGHEKHKYLKEDGKLDRPEIDHIVPSSKGGANLFCNARIVSWELNNRGQRVVNANDKQTKWKK